MKFREYINESQVNLKWKKFSQNIFRATVNDELFAQIIKKGSREWHVEFRNREDGKIPQTNRFSGSIWNTKKDAKEEVEDIIKRELK